MVKSTKTTEDDTLSPAEQAIRWLVRSRAGSTESFDRCSFEEWYRQNPENRREFDRAETLWQQLSDLQPIYSRQRERGWMPFWGRAPWLGLAVGALSILFVARLFVGGLPQLTSTTFATAEGDRQDVILKDGTIIHMNADTVVIAEPSLWKRRYRLDQGEAEFVVTHNALRPFQVTVGTAVIHDLGTRFDVRREQGGARLSVFEGAVELDNPDSLSSSKVISGQAVLFDSAGISPLAPVNEQMLTAWRNGKFIFADSSLADVVVQLNRYRQTPIIMRDYTIGGLRVSGSFDTNNTDGILRALELALPIAVQNDPASGQVLLTAKPNAVQP